MSRKVRMYDVKQMSDKKFIETLRHDLGEANDECSRLATKVIKLEAKLNAKEQRFAAYVWRMNGNNN